MTGDATWFVESWFGADDWLQLQDENEVESLFSTENDDSPDLSHSQVQPQSEEQQQQNQPSLHLEETDQSQPEVQLPLQVHSDDEFETTLMNQVITQRGIFTKEAQIEMSNWITQNWECPFLKKEEEDYFCTKHGLTRRQVKTAFNNRRQRILAPFRLKGQQELLSRQQPVRRIGQLGAEPRIAPFQRTE
jgi:hypothetical protein